MSNDPPPSTPSYLVRRADGTFVDVSQPEREIKEWEYLIPSKNDQIRSVEITFGEKIMKDWEKTLLELEQKRL